MHPKLIARTHYQADELAFLLLLILECTTATRSDYRERVAERLMRALLRKGKTLNLGAAKYVVDLARYFNLLNERYIWTDRAQLISLISEQEDFSPSWELSPIEKIMFFRFLLDSDGAALLFLAKEFEQTDVLPRKDENLNALANRMFIFVFSEYRKITSHISDRTMLRQELEKREARPFKGNSGRHQMYFHLQSAYRIGLIEGHSEQPSRRRRFMRRKNINPDPMQALREGIPGVAHLEKIVQHDEQFDHAKKIFSFDLPDPSENILETGEAILTEIRSDYDELMLLGQQSCPLRPLLEALILRRIATGVSVATYQSLYKTLIQHQRAHPSEVHLHVNRLGQPTYIRF